MLTSSDGFWQICVVQERKNSFDPNQTIGIVQERIKPGGFDALNCAQVTNGICGGIADDVILVRKQEPHLTFQLRKFFIPDFVEC